MAIHELYPYIHARNADEAIAFYKTAFGVTEKFRLVEPSGRIGHAELAFGDTTLMICDEFPEYDALAPREGETCPFVLHIHVDDCDAVIERAMAAGAILLREAQDMFYGERSGLIRDPFGYSWLVGNSFEEVEPAEMQRRYTALLSDDPA